MSVKNKVLSNTLSTVAQLNAGAQWLPALFLRLILFWEFWESGMTKLNGSNWFGSIKDSFPFPFNIIPTDVSWFMATWGEIIFSILILVGIFTRLAAMSLLVITAVATAAVHWPTDWSSLSNLWQGYAISDKGYGNFKLPLLYILMLFPLVFSGAGKLSIDELISKKIGVLVPNKQAFNLLAIGLGLIVVGLPLSFLMPVFAILLILSGFALALLYKLRTKSN